MQRISSSRIQGTWGLYIRVCSKSHLEGWQEDKKGEVVVVAVVVAAVVVIVDGKGGGGGVAVCTKYLSMYYTKYVCNLDTYLCSVVEEVRCTGWWWMGVEDGSPLGSCLHPLSCSMRTPVYTYPVPRPPATVHSRPR